MLANFQLLSFLNILDDHGIRHYSEVQVEKNYEKNVNFFKGMGRMDKRKVT